MRDFLLFFQKYGSVFIFMILQGISMLFVFSKTNPYHHSKFANSSNQIIGNVYESSNKIRSYFYLQEEIDLLKKQNTILQEQLKGSRIVVGNYFSKKKDTLYMQQYLFQSASVIKSTRSKRYNYVTINKGSSNGVTKDMGVVGTNGILGYVVATSAHFSTVLPVIHPRFEVPVRHKRTNTFGFVTWGQANNSREATIKGFAKITNIQIGDTIITTGGESYFPEGELVGFVRSKTDVAGKGTQIVTIELAEDYGNIHSVFVIDNFVYIHFRKTTLKFYSV